MKRFTLILGVAALAAISAPITARAQTGCSWWDLSCNGLASRVTDYGWHMTGRDTNGNVTYLRRRVDSNGNVVFEQATRNNYGQYLVQNNHLIRKGTVYGPNGEICKYNSNDKGYKEDCKYAKAYNVAKIKPVKYEAPKYHAPKYKPVKYEGPKYKAPKAIHYDLKGKEEKGKGKGPKH